MGTKKVVLKKPQKASNLRRFIASRNTLLITIPQSIVIDAELDKFYSEAKQAYFKYNKAQKTIEICLETPKVPTPAKA